ncbi:alpha/beta hydrolase [Paraburkholderia sediminicola]|uniref:Alpha/beta hydrolase n=1 Tax=Paraburkholderia metrosideri TaxID=580937 RepID=A0ABW9E6B0_9BURK
MRNGTFSRPLGRRLELLAWLLKLSEKNSIETCTEAEIEADQKPMPRNLLTDWIFGARAAGVVISDSPRASDCPAIRLYVPDRRDAGCPGLLYFHGGGWVSGDPGLTDWWCSAFAAHTGTLVVSVDYRLAPRHRYPAALEDGYAALCWLHLHAVQLGIDVGQISVAGDSAGANLTAALCLYARDLGGPPISGQTLICPALDLTLSSPSMSEKAHAPLLTARAVSAYARHYLGDPALARNPLASPLLAENLSALPPALIQVAEHDPLRDDGWRYAARLRAAGVEVRVTEYAGAPHGLTTFSGLTRLSRHALEEACAASAIIFKQ